MLYKTAGTRDSAVSSPTNLVDSVLVQGIRQLKIWIDLP